MKQAAYYHIEQIGGNGHDTAGGTLAARCDLCPHACLIGEGHAGRCRSRVFRDGKLWATSYAEPCALAVDPVEKKPLNHFHPGTLCLSVACTGCNLRCLNCQNSSISQARPEDVEHATWQPADLVGVCLQQHLPSIAYTYTEPLTWIEYMLDTARLAHEQGIYNILVSAGYVNEQPLRDLLPFLDAANIDLKSISDDVYHRLNGASLAPVQRTLRLIHEAGVALEVTNLLVDGWNTSEEMVRALCRWLVDNGMADVPLHLSRCFPSYRMPNLRPTPFPVMMRAKDIAEEEGIRWVHLGNV